MKKILMALVALVMTTGAFAQGFGQFNPEDMAKMQADHIKEVCKTNDDQNKKIVEYFVADSKEMQKMFEQSQGGFDMEAFQKRMDKQTEFLKSVLTKEQFAAYEEDQRKMREQWGGGF